MVTCPTGTGEMDQTAAKTYMVIMTRDDIIHAAACVGRNIGRIDQPGSVSAGAVLREAASKLGITWEEITEYGNKLSFSKRDRGQCSW